MRTLTHWLFSLILIGVYATSHAWTLPKHHLHLQLGDVYVSPASNSQDILIQGLIGDVFTSTYRSRLSNNNNIFYGLGYFFDGPTYGMTNIYYGLDAFYLGQINVKGDVTAEGLFTNLSFQYTQTNIPIYASIKGEIKNDMPDFSDMAITFDLGAGPNIQPTTFQESSIDNGVTIPDNIFAGANNLSSITFGATVGAGLKINDVFFNVPLECGYRFFYLGGNGLSKKTNQVVNTLNVPYYAQAVICAISF